jgi:WD40 repeat protein
LPALATALQTAVEGATGEPAEPWNGIEPLAAAVRRWTADVQQLLLILDQFEEYFLYHPPNGAPGAFDEVFAGLVNDPDLRINMLLSLREDAWSRLDRFKGRIPLLFDNYLRVDYLAPAEAHEAVLGPIAHYNTVMAGELPVTVEPALVEQVLRDVRAGRLALAHGRAPNVSPRGDADDDSGRVETPYLQLVMERLWDAAAEGWSAGGERVLTLALLEGLGGADAIVARHLHDALGALTEAEQEIAAAVFEFLVTPSKTKIAHRASDLAHFTKRSPAEVERVLGLLSERSRRILREVPSPEGLDDAMRYELYHDVLAEALLKWCAERAELREQAAFEERLREEHAERRRRRRRWMLRGLQLGVLIALVGGLLYAVALRVDGTAGSRSAQRAKFLAARAEADLATTPTTDPLHSLLLARAAIDQAPVPPARAALADSVAGSPVRAILQPGIQQRPCPVGCELGTPTPEQMAQDKLSNSSPSQVSFMPGNRVALLLGDRVVVWDPRAGHVRQLARSGDVASIKARADGTVLFTRSLHVRFGLSSRSTPTHPGLVEARLGGYVAGSVSRDARFVASGLDTSRYVVVVRGLDGGRRKSLRLRTPVDSVAFDPRDPGTLAIGSRSVWLWHWRTGERTRLVRHAPSTPLYSLRFNRDGDLLAAQGRDGSIETWSGNRRRHHWSSALTGITPASRPLMSLSPGGSRILIAEGPILYERATANGSITPFSGPADGVNDMNFSPDGTRVVTAQSDGVARIWDASAGTVILELRGHPGAVVRAAFAPDGRHVVTVGDDGTARLWAARGTVVAVMPPRSRAVPGPGGTGAVVTTARGRILLASPRGGEMRALPRFRIGKASVLATAVAGGGRVKIALAGGGLRVLDTATGATTRLGGAGRGTLDSVVLSADGRRLAAGKGTRLFVWDLGRPASPRRLLAAPASRLKTLAFAPRGHLLIVASRRGVTVIDADSDRAVVPDRPKLTRDVDTTNAAVDAYRPSFRAVLSPDGHTMAVAGPTGVILWNSVTRATTLLTDTARTYTHVAFSRHGHFVAATAADGVVRVWASPGGGHEVLSVPALGGGPSLATFTATGDLLTVGANGVVQRVPCLPCRPLASLRGLADRQAIRPMTAAERQVVADAG